MSDSPSDPSATLRGGNDSAASASPPVVEAVAAPGAAAPADEDSFAFLHELHRVPCFRESVLYGGGGGALLGALHFQRTRSGERAADVAVKASLVFASAYWLMCRRNYRAQRASVRTSIDAVGRAAAEGVALKQRLGLAPPGLAPSATADEPGAAREAPPAPPQPPSPTGGGVGHA